MPPPLPERALARDWLVQVRWGAALGQLATAGFAAFALEYPLPLAAVAALIGATAFTNLVLPRLDHPLALPAAVVVDLLVLTALLALTGGASNPFSVLYLLHVALAAVLLGPTWTWVVTLLASAGFGSLFFFTDPHAMHRGEGLVAAHLWGMWLALAATGAGIAWFVARLAGALREHEREVVRLRRVAEGQERVVALATLAASAAHELGSPLAAIAVGAREIEGLAEGPIVEEARAVREQVERCRQIVSRLTQRAGAPVAEGSVPMGIGEVRRVTETRLTEDERMRVTFPSMAPVSLVLHAPPDALAEALAALIRNGLASGPGSVAVEVARRDREVIVTVADHGSGMVPDVLARAGEPFFTTRPAGEGMGLGLFLVRRFAESLGGTVEIVSAAGSGTRVALRLPGPG